MGGHNVLVYAGTHGETVRAMVAIDSPATYPAFAKETLKEMAERLMELYNGPWAGDASKVFESFAY